MKKLSVGLMATFLVASFAVTGFANDFRGYHRNGRDLTPEQKQSFIEYATKKNELRKQFLNQEVAAGRMTQEAANAHITLMNEHTKRFQENKTHYPLTPQARDARYQYNEKVRELRAEQLKKDVQNGLITQEQADRMSYGHRGDDRGSHRNNGGHYNDGGHYYN